VEFELVTKYRNKLYSYARRYNVPPEDVFQEARIVEWRMSKYSPAHKVSYFLKSCKINTLKIANFGVVELDEKAQECLISSGDFDRWFEIYVEELADILYKIDEVVGDMFLVKVNNELSWASIRRSFFNEVPKNRYWHNVQAIKEKAYDYIKGEDKPFLQLLEAV